MGVIIRGPLEQVPPEYLEYLVRRDVSVLMKFHRADYMLFPKAGFALWLFAGLLGLTLGLSAHSGELDRTMVPGGLALIAVLLLIPPGIMAIRAPRFLYRHKAYNEGFIKTEDAFLLREERDFFCLFPYTCIRSVQLTEGRYTSAGEAQARFLDVEIIYEDQGNLRTFLARDMILNHLPSYYTDTPPKRRAAAFFGTYFVENELSSFDLYQAARKKSGS